MSLQVVLGTEIQCSFGMAPSVLMVEPEGSPVLVNGLPAATIMDFIPLDNILPFGMCMSLANPEVDAATAAALGVLTPMPCIPVTTDPWFPGSETVLIDDMPALTETCMCMCDWGGLITIGEVPQVCVLTSDV